MKKFIGLLVVIFFASSGHVLARTKAAHETGPAGGFILDGANMPDTLAHIEVSKKDLEGTYKWNNAISACEDLREDGFSDWMLPSKEVLNLMYQQREAIGGFADASYWSSSEIDDNYAWEQYFDGGYQEYSTKGFNFNSHVRCVRTF